MRPCVQPMLVNMVQVTMFSPLCLQNLSIVEQAAKRASKRSRK
jgi:hypothetical protein